MSCGRGMWSTLVEALRDLWWRVSVERTREATVILRNSYRIELDIRSSWHSDNTNEVNLLNRLYREVVPVAPYSGGRRMWSHPSLYVDAEG